MSQESVDEYEDENPVVVVDDAFSLRPFTDREILSEMLQSLAIEIHQALQKDREDNNRYATRLVISNRLKHSNPRRKRKKREEFEVKLPYTCMTWNEMNLEDVQIQFFRRIVDINDQYKWYKIKVRATHFMSQETRTQIDILEAEENQEANKPQPSKDTHKEPQLVENSKIGEDDDEDIEIICEIQKK